MPEVEAELDRARSRVPGSSCSSGSRPANGAVGHRVAQDRDRVPVGLAGVDDQRQPARRARPRCGRGRPAPARRLGCARSGSRGRSRRCRSPSDGRRAASSGAGSVERLLGRPVRVHADRAVDPRIGLGDREHAIETCRARVPIVCITCDAGRTGAREDRLALLGERREVEMAVAVDQHPRGCSAKRGKTPPASAAACPAASCGLVPIVRERCARPRAPPSWSRIRADASGRNAWVNERQPADGLGQRVEHGRHARRVGLAQRPGRLRVDVAVGGADDLEDRLERAAQRLHRHLGAHAVEQSARLRRAAGRRRP